MGKDHILQSNYKVLDQVILEMENVKSDFLLYTFFCYGYHKSAYERAISEQQNVGKFISTFKFTFCNYYKIINLRKSFPLINQYVTSLPSIFSRKLFIKLLDQRHFNFKLKQTPHFMKSRHLVYDICHLIFYLNEKLFASIDDDRGIKIIFVSRGKYPKELILNFHTNYKAPKSFFDNFLFPEKLRL